MEFRQLRYFVAVAEMGNIGLAAQRLNISQPPVTRQIRALELELGVELLIRTPRGVELTEAGRVFKQEAERILQSTDRARERSRNAHQGMIGKFDVAFFGSTVYRAVPSVLRRFKSLYPDIELRLTRLGKNDQIDAILDNRIHVGFGRYYAIHPGILQRVVTEETLLVAVRNDGELAGRDGITMAELAPLPMILFPAGDRPSFADEVIGIFRRLGHTVLIETFAPDSASALAQVACGSGVCVVPSSIAALKLPMISFVPITDADLTVPISCIYGEDTRNPIVSRFLDCLDDYILETE